MFCDADSISTRMDTGVFLCVHACGLERTEEDFAGLRENVERQNIYPHLPRGKES